MKMLLKIIDFKFKKFLGRTSMIEFILVKLQAYSVQTKTLR